MSGFRHMRYRIIYIFVICLAKKRERPENAVRRKDREVLNREEITDILSRCSTLRIGIQGEDYPYVVPVSFGLDTEGGKPAVYFHSAKQGMKISMLQQSRKLCVEGDIFMGIEKTAHGITARYESVIGFGTGGFVDAPEEVLKGLGLILEHYGYSDYPLDGCMGLEHVLIGKIVLETLTGKRNLPDSPAAKDMEAETANSKAGQTDESDGI